MGLSVPKHFEFIFSCVYVLLSVKVDNRNIYNCHNINYIQDMAKNRKYKKIVQNTMLGLKVLAPPVPAKTYLKKIIYRQKGFNHNLIA